MTEISDLESRLSAALDRIRSGVERLGISAGEADAIAPDAADGPTLAQVQARLAEERDANAQLEERVKALKARQDGRLAELEAQADGARIKMAKVDKDLQRLRQVNAELRDINAKLRAAVAAGVTEPHLINLAMQAELEALRAVRAADAAEVDAVLDALRPILAPQTPEEV